MLLNQGAHGFIKTHKWNSTIGAFINIEASGSGGAGIISYLSLFYLFEIVRLCNSSQCKSWRLSFLFGSIIWNDIHVLYWSVEKFQEIIKFFAKMARFWSEITKIALPRRKWQKWYLYRTKLPRQAKKGGNSAFRTALQYHDASTVTMMRTLLPWCEHCLNSAPFL